MSRAKASGSRSAAARGSAFSRPVVWGPLVLLLLAGGALLWQWQQQQVAAAEERQQLIDQVLAATGRAEPDSAELSQLVTRIGKYPDHETAPDLLAAAARIELARQRPERAQALFGARAAMPDATPAEQGLGAEILLRLHEADAGDSSTATGMLRQIQAMAEHAYDASGDANDLLRAWQAASRLPDQAALKRLAERLQATAPGSPAAQLAELAGRFEHTMPLATFDALRAGFVSPPPELEAMRVLLVLQSGDVRSATTAAEALLLRAPGVLAVRWTAALVFHARVLGEQPGSGERGQWLARRNPQLEWLLRRAPADDERRRTWDEMLRSH